MEIQHMLYSVCTLVGKPPENYKKKIIDSSVVRLKRGGTSQNNNFQWRTSVRITSLGSKYCLFLVVSLE